MIALGVAFKYSLVDRPSRLKWASFLCRVIGLVLLILAICRPYLKSESDRLHVVMLVDVSESMDLEGMRNARDAVSEVI